MRRRGDPLDDFDSDEDWFMMFLLFRNIYIVIENVEPQRFKQNNRNSYKSKENKT